MHSGGEQSLISNIEALRQTLLKCLTALCAGGLFTLFIAPDFLNLLIKIITQGNDVCFNFFSPAEVFLIQLKIALLLDVMICFPYIAKQIWDFILPALYDNEKTFIKKIVFSSSVLFVLGILFCIFIVMPFVMNFGLSFAAANLNPVFGISNIINLTLWMSVSFGLMFQFPLITIALIKNGIMSYKTISDKRPYVIVIILILAAVFTPPDIISQLMLVIPAYLLFELGLLASRPRKQVHSDS